MAGKPNITKIAVGAFILAVGVFIAYSVLQYQKSGIAQDGLVTCVEEKCFWNAHIHVYTPIQICGVSYPLPAFEGALTDLHTHGEDNLVHFHDRIAFDLATKTFLEPSPFPLELVFSTFELPISNDSLLGKKDGDQCGDAQSTWKVAVNGKVRSDWRTYEWKDHDVVLFVFDARSTKEIEAEIRANPIAFPSVGEG